MQKSVCERESTNVRRRDSESVTVRDKEGEGFIKFIQFKYRIQILRTPNKCNEMLNW